MTLVDAHLKQFYLFHYGNRYLTETVDLIGTSFDEVKRKLLKSFDGVPLVFTPSGLNPICRGNKCPCKGIIN